MSAERYVITGLPRSRTSWLANLFCWGPSLCLHDASATCDVEARWRWLEVSDKTIRYLGNADSGCLLTGIPITASKVVYVRRDANEAKASFVKYMTQHPYPGLPPPNPDLVDGLFQKAEAAALEAVNERGELGYTINYDDLEDGLYVQQLWEFVLPDVKFPIERWRIVDRLRVNPMSEKVRILWAQQ